MTVPRVCGAVQPTNPPWRCSRICGAVQPTTIPRRFRGSAVPSNQQPSQDGSAGLRYRPQRKL